MTDNETSKEKVKEYTNKNVIKKKTGQGVKSMYNHKITEMYCLLTVDG